MRALTLIVLLVLLTSAAFADSTNTLTAKREFIWSDSAITHRDPFAKPPPPEVAKPDTIDGRLYWHGGAFVLPGTSDSVLLANGFVNVKRQPGSTMHDYFEAWWPVEMKSDELPLEIRQVRYSTKPLYAPEMRWNTFVERIGDGVYREVYLFVIPGLPPDFLLAQGILCDSVPGRTLGWADEYRCYWERERRGGLLPPEIYQVTVPEENATPKRINSLPQPSPHYSYHRRPDGFGYIWGFAKTESKADTAVLRRLGFIVDMGNPYLYPPGESPFPISVFWHKNLVVDSLPAEIRTITIEP